MSIEKQIQPRRKSIRLKEYDYSQPGAYFVTICTQNRECLFGRIVDEKIVLNDSGQMITNWYNELPNKFPDIKCYEYIVMPNHFHAVIVNVGADLCVCPENGTDFDASQGQGEHTGSPLPQIMQWFKTMTTNEYIRGVKQHDWPPFHGKLWQRNYFERVIRDDDELNCIREYIVYNPLKWDLDKDNPQNWNSHTKNSLGD